MISEIQSEIAAHLNGLTFFAAAPAIVARAENSRDIVSELATAIDSLGIAVLVRTPSMSSDVPGPYPAWNRIEIGVRVMENPIINRAEGGSLQPASKVAEAVAVALTHLSLTSLGGNRLRSKSISERDDADLLVYDVALESGGVQPTMPSR